MGPAYQAASGVTDGAGFADFKGQDPKHPGSTSASIGSQYESARTPRTAAFPLQYQTVLGKRLRAAAARPRTVGGCGSIFKASSRRRFLSSAE